MPPAPRSRLAHAPRRSRRHTARAAVSVLAGLELGEQRAARLDRDAVAAHARLAGAHERLPGLEVVLPTVPRAGDRGWGSQRAAAVRAASATASSEEVPAAQRAALVRAAVADAEEAIPDAEDADRPAARLDDPPLPGGNSLTGATTTLTCRPPHSSVSFVVTVIVFTVARQARGARPIFTDRPPLSSINRIYALLDKYSVSRFSWSGVRVACDPGRRRLMTARWRAAVSRWLRSRPHTEGERCPRRLQRWRGSA